MRREMEWSPFEEYMKAIHFRMLYLQLECMNLDFNSGIIIDDMSLYFNSLYFQTLGLFEMIYHNVHSKEGRLEFRDGLHLLIHRLILLASRFAPHSIQSVERCLRRNFYEIYSRHHPF